MAKYASEVVKLAKSWVGIKEGSQGHKGILEIYNSQNPLPRGHKMTIKEPWCAMTITALAVKLGYTDIIPCECSCGKLIEIAKKMGIWIEDESITPTPGMLALYDWGDNGKGDCQGDPEHIGVVEKVANGEITVIEGNYDGADADRIDGVERRVLKVNGKYLRGFIAPKYDAEPVKPAATKEVMATDSARYFLASLAGTYKVTANSGLNVRHGAGITKKKMVAIPKGTAVKNYGFYSKSLGVKWLYIQFTYKGVKYTGFASSNYLKK